MASVSGNAPLPSADEAARKAYASRDRAAALLAERPSPSPSGSMRLAAIDTQLALVAELRALRRETRPPDRSRI